MRAVLYLRVSTDGQTTENQQRLLEAAAARAGWTIITTLTDNGISGAKGREQRPAFDTLHKLIARRQVDIVATWSVDRLGRSLQDLVSSSKSYARSAAISTCTRRESTPRHRPDAPCSRYSACSPSSSAASSRNESAPESPEPRPRASTAAGRASIRRSSERSAPPSPKVRGFARSRRRLASASAPFSASRPNALRSENPGVPTVASVGRSAPDRSD
jgi:Resolvase, N terminal domain